MKIRGLSIFWRCFITYALCTFFFLCILFYTFSQMTKEWKTSYIGQVSDSFESNASVFSENLFTVYYFHQAMSGSDYFSTVSALPTISIPSHSYYISRVMSNVRSQRGYFQLAEEILIYLKKSGNVLTGSYFYSGPEDCFSRHYIYTTLDIPSVIRGIQGSSRSLLPCPVDSVVIRSGAPRDYLTLVLNQTDENSVYVFLVPSDKITGAFQLATLPENTFFSFRDSDGTTLFTYGSPIQNTDDYISMTCKIQSIGGTVTLNIPESFFDNVTLPAKRKVISIFIITSLLGLAMCFLFSHLNAMPVKQLIENAGIPRETTSSNEFTVISSYISQAKENRAKLQKQLLSILLARAFSGLPVTENDISSALEDSVLFRQPTHMSVLRCPFSAEHPDQNSYILSELKKRLSMDYIFEALNAEEFGIVFPAGGDSIRTLKSVLEILNQDPDTGGNLSCGVSAAFAGYENIPDAVQQARYMLPEGKEILMIFSSASVRPASLIGEPDLKLFQAALFNWNKAEISRLLAVFAETARKESPAYAQQIFYTLLAFIKDTANAIKVPADLYKECTFARSISAEANIRALQKLTDDLFEQKAALQTDRKARTRRELIEYADTNYSDPALTVGTLSDEFRKTEREINSIFLSETGMSFSGYLVSIRMRHAAVLLRDTELEANEVSAKCGLALSTFYRNFKKAYGMTPVDYKKQFYEKRP